MTDAEQGQAFMDLLAPLWPRPARRGRPPDAATAILLNFDMLLAVFQPAWPRGADARKAAIDQVLQVNQGKLFLLPDARADIVRCATARQAVMRILVYLRGDLDSPEGTEKTTEQALYRARRRVRRP